MAKLGEGRLGEMIDRGGRELGGFLYPDSNIAQPMYPRHRAYEASKEANEQGMSLGDRLKQTEISHDDHGMDEPDQGIDREI
jgi:hypothetical protein